MLADGCDPRAVTRRATCLASFRAHRSRVLARGVGVSMLNRLSPLSLLFVPRCSGRAGRAAQPVRRREKPRPRPPPRTVPLAARRGRPGHLIALRDVRRRRARRRAHRRAQGAPGAPRAHRRDRGHEHRRGGRRLLRVGHDGRSTLENLVDSLEWESAFLNVTPRRLKSFHRKRDDDPVPRRPEAGPEPRRVPAADRFRAGPGDRHLDPVARDAARVTRGRFDRLAVPFRAGRGDLASGEPVTWRSGSPGARAAREHVDPRRAHADGDRRPAARRRRHLDELADRSRAIDGRGRRDCGRRHFAAA